jgi:hypothetical protein
MGETTTAPGAGSRSGLFLLWPVGAAVAFWLSGFLIVALRNARYGFLAVDPMDARILLAGAWFCAFAGLPLGMAAFRAEQRPISWPEFPRFLFRYFVGSLVISVPAGRLFEYTTAAGSYTGFALATSTLEIAGLYVLVIYVEKNYPRLATYGVLLIIFAGLAAMLWNLAGARQFLLDAVALWFFGLGTIALLAIHFRPQDVHAAAVPLALLLPALLIFAFWFYPRLKAGWGGGNPVPATVWFSSESPLRPGQSMRVRLIDETAAGYYATGETGSRATFIPRKAVSLVSFSAEPSGSDSLR